MEKACSNSGQAFKSLFLGWIIFITISLGTDILVVFLLFILFHGIILFLLVILFHIYFLLSHRYILLLPFLSCQKRDANSEKQVAFIKSGYN